jgi:hypothetical protein
MNTIEININQAKIERFETVLDDDLPRVSATIGLYAGSKKISTFVIGSYSYYGKDQKFDLPIEMIEPIMAIARRLEAITTMKCKQALMELPEGNQP